MAAAPGPKRVEVTTELREYWVCVARNDPAELRKMARRVLNRTPRYADLYGVDDPLSLSRAEREAGSSLTSHPRTVKPPGASTRIARCS